MEEQTDFESKADCQAIALALATLAIERPGWKSYLRGIAERHGGAADFDMFLAIDERARKLCIWPASTELERKCRIMDGAANILDKARATLAGPLELARLDGVNHELAVVDEQLLMVAQTLRRGRRITEVG
jgi:hypothetical protein